MTRSGWQIGEKTLGIPNVLWSEDNEIDDDEKERSWCSSCNSVSHCTDFGEKPQSLTIGENVFGATRASWLSLRSGRGVSRLAGMKRCRGS